MISENIRRVRQRIDEACRRAGRNSADVMLVAVSKTFDAETVARAVECGIRDFGENYIQELAAKRELLGRDDIRWHFIGHLQKNKINRIAGWIGMVHALDSAATARALGIRAAGAGRTIEMLIEVNTTGESSKFGVKPEAAPDIAREINAIPGLRLTGLMTMGPLTDDPSGARRSFSALRNIRDGLNASGLNMPHLSMGMTGDFETAIEEGATILRIGSAIFGARPGVAGAEQGTETNR